MKFDIMSISWNEVCKELWAEYEKMKDMKCYPFHICAQYNVINAQAEWPRELVIVLSVKLYDNWTENRSFEERAEKAIQYAKNYEEEFGKFY